MADGDYDLSRLSNRSFEQLVQSLCIKAIGVSTTIFGDGKDGGREATFEGLSNYTGKKAQWDGYHVIQAKYRLRPNGQDSDADWALGQLRAEFKEYTDRPKRRRPKYYIFATNVVLSPVEHTGGKDRLMKWLNENSPNLGIVDFDVWDFDKLRTFLDNNSDVRQKYANLITPGDVLAGMFDTAQQLRHLPSATKQIESQLDRLIDKLPNTLTEKPAFPTEVPSIGSPPMPEICAERQNTVDALLQLNREFSWVFVSGAAGSGKSQLVLLASTRVSCRGWFRFRDLSETQVAVRLDSALAAITGKPPLPDAQSFYALAAAQIGKGNLVVLDDLPRLTPGSEAIERLVLLAKALAAEGAQLITTSMHQPPTSLGSSIPAKGFHAIQAPPFQDAETEDLFKKLGAPQQFISAARIRIINLHAKGHPILLTAAACYFSERQWRFTEKELEGLSRNDHTSELALEARNRLMQIVTPEARGLLYRLNIIAVEFSAEDVEAMASVPPEIRRPHEQLNILLGYCIQRETSKTMSISPVFQVLGASDVPPDVRRLCHRAIGRRLVSGRHLTPITAMRAIGHFLQGDEFNKAGQILLSALRSLREIEGKVFDYGILAMWINEPLPREMQIGLRAAIRLCQIALRARRGLEIQYLAADAALLADAATPEDVPAMLLDGGIVWGVIAERDFVAACRIWLRTVALASALRSPDGQPLNIPEGGDVKLGVWTLAQKLKSAEDLRKWIAAIDSLTSEQRNSIFSAEEAAEFSLFLSNKLWLIELEKKESNRNWKALSEVTVELAVASRRWEAEILWASAQRIQIIMLGENFEDIESSVKLAMESLQQASNDPRVRFLLEEALGRQLFYARRNDDARHWLGKALAHSIADFSIVRLFSHLQYSVALGDSDAGGAIRHAQAAVSIAKAPSDDDTIPESEVITALAELAVAYYFAGDLKSAFAAWDEAAQRLLAVQHDTPEWKELFVVFGHVAGYFSIFARTGAGPEMASDGGVYGAPYRGLFGTTNPQRAQLYDAEKLRVLPTHLTIFATAVGNDSRALFWAEKAIANARASGQLQFLSVVASEVVPLYLKIGNYDAAISLEVEACNIMEAISILRKQGTPIDARIELETVLGPKTNPKWMSAERQAMLLLSAPLVAHLGLLTLGNSATAAADVIRAIEAVRRRESDALDKIGWEGIAVVLERGLLDKKGESLLGFGNSFDLNTNRGVRIAAYLSESMRDRGDPARALHAQTAAMPFVDTYFSSVPAAHILIAEFVAKYWEDSVSRMPFRFASPKLVQQELVEARQLAASARLRAVLKCATASLGIRISKDISHWISTGKMDGAPSPRR